MPRHCLSKHVLRFLLAFVDKYIVTNKSPRLGFYTLLSLGYCHAPAPLQVQFIMPKSAADQMQRQIEYGDQGIDEVIESLSHVDSARATAWKLEDETKVKLEGKIEFVLDELQSKSYVLSLNDFHMFCGGKKHVFSTRSDQIRLRKSLIQELGVRFCQMRFLHLRIIVVLRFLHCF